MTSLEAANPAATSALERTKSRREKMLFLDMRRPAFLVLAAPHLRRFRIALDAPVFRVELQFAVHFPRDVGKLQHSNSDVPTEIGALSFSPLRIPAMKFAK